MDYLLAWFIGTAVVAIFYFESRLSKIDSKLKEISDKLDRLMEGQNADPPG
jgi:hypothetical protein